MQTPVLHLQLALTALAGRRMALSWYQMMDVKVLAELKSIFDRFAASAAAAQGFGWVAWRCPVMLAAVPILESC